MRNISIIVVITFLCISLFADKNDELIEAAKNGDVEKVKQLIAQGADVSAKVEYGRIALILAAMEGHTKIVKLLIQAGADMNAGAYTCGRALMWAAAGCNTEIVKLLIQAGADVNAKNSMISVQP